MSDASAILTVVATYSRRMRLRHDDGSEVDGRIKGKRLRVVCGDRVRAEPLPMETDWLITERLPRRNALTRPDRGGRREVLAANADRLVVTAAVTPEPDWFVVDRYVCAAELMAAEPLVVFNKCDRIDAAGGPPAVLDDYRRIGLGVFVTGATADIGIDALRDALADGTTLLVGQSGVGKSTLLNALTGTQHQPTAAISEKTREGRHTTVNSVMIYMKNGGQLIDSPGVRDYAPTLDSTADVARGYREIAAAAAHCRFANCLHLREPGCAVKAGVEDDAIAARRYESYKRLLHLTERLAPRRN